MKEKFIFQRPKSEFVERKNQELIERLEKALLPIEDKVELLLVWRDLIPARDISISSQSWKENEPPKYIDPKRVGSLKKLVEDMKLYYAVSPKQIVDGEYFYTTENGQEKLEKKEEIVLYVAKKKEDLDLFIRAIKTKNDQLLGILYGYPDSAVKAYCEEEKTGEKRTIGAGELPKDIQKRDDFAFARFKLSRDNWSEELETGKRWARVVKETSPKLYNEFMELMSKVSYD